jgi:pyruvate dehydrogenase phosphatase
VGEALSSPHNGLVQSEVERIRSEHPGEDDAVIGYRVLGALMVTRGKYHSERLLISPCFNPPSALGDHAFKLPSVWTHRVFLNATPGFLRPAKVAEFIPRSLTPPYVSCVAEIMHKRLVPNSGALLVLSSDGLTELLVGEGKDPRLSKDTADKIAKVVGEAEMEHAALVLLKEGLGGVDVDKCSQYLTVEMEQPWMDDTTVVVLRL